jgi:hypothetical protein
LSRKTNNISILQFDERVITRLRVHRGSKGVEILGFDMERGDWSAREGSLETALRDFATKYNLAEDHLFTVLPRYDMTARILELPSQDINEIGGMVRLSAEEYVPFSADELVTDQCILNKIGAGSSSVLAVFAHREVVESHVKLLQAAKIDPEQIFLSTVCLAAAAAAARRAGGERYALVNLASGGLEVIVMRGERLEYGRAVASQHDWTLDGDSARDILDELCVEVRASLSAHRRESEDGEGVQAIYVCSETSDGAVHAESLAQDISEFLSVDECAPALFARDLVTQGAEKLSTLPMVSLGAALMAQERASYAIRLLPETLLRSRERKSAKKEFVKLGVLAAAILFVLFCGYEVAVRQLTSYIRELNGKIAKIEPHANGIVSKQDQLKILQRQVERSGSVLELLGSLVELFPENEMNITHFQFTHNEKIDVTGRTKTLKAIENFAHKLTEVGKNSIPQFARAQRVYEQEVSEKGQQIWDYRIVLPFPETERPEAEDDSSEEVSGE